MASITPPAIRFLSDADTYVPPDQDGMGYMLAEIERGADAVGGIPSTALKGAGLLPHIRATVKLPMIVMKRTLQQLLGGAPFIISGACGMFRTDVLRKFGFSDRTKVEDLDLTWTLVANGYRIRQANRCIVYPQECNSPREEWRRWRRWIVGYAVCMRLHKRLLFSRFGIFSIFPMLLVVLYGVGIYLTTWFNEFITTGPHGVVLAMFPLIWVGVVCVIGAFSAWFHRCWLLVPLAPLSVVYVLLAYAIWIIYGLIAFFTGREPQRDKPTRYSALVEVSTAYSHPSVTGTENYLKLNVKEKNIQIADQVIIDESAGEVVIGANTRICHGAVIQGPVVIGANCLIGNYAFIRPGTIISNGVRIGFATEIKNAVIEAEATIGPQCFIADSVVANQAYLGAQVRTSNHRLDEQPVSVRTPDGIIATGCDKLGCYIGQRSRLGVQVIILPGRIISPNTQLGPRVIVERNLPTGTYSLRQELIRTGD